MTLPSPLFASNVPKPSVPPPNVTKQPSNRNIQYVAFCKFCSEGFPNEGELAQHRRSHEKCPFDDCKFNASGKVVAAHVQRVHMKTNTLVKIQDLTTPEQIEKWREERRKRYPTSANVTLRQQAREQRMERGEKLQDRQQRFGDSEQKNHIKNFDKRNGDRNKQNKNRHHQKRDHQNQNHKNNARDESKKPRDDKSALNLAKPFAPKVNDKRKAPVIVPIVPMGESSDEDAVSTPKFTGTSQMKDYHKVETIVKEQAALSILGMYGSESDTEDDSGTQPAVEVSESVESTTEVVPADVEMAATDDIIPNEEAEHQEPIEDDNEAPEEQPISHDAQNEPEPGTSTDKNRRKRKHESYQQSRAAKMKTRSILDYAKLRSRPSANPFLEKLLQEDIRHERNVLLQCVNYVVRNNFFESLPAVVSVEVPSSQAESVSSGVEKGALSVLPAKSNEEVGDFEMK